MILKEVRNGDRAPKLIHFNNNGDILNVGAIGNLGLVNHEDIRVSFDSYRYAYALTRSDSKIVVSWWDVFWGVRNQVAIDYSSFGGYDLYHQDFYPPNAALFAYSIATQPGGPHEVYLGEYRENDPVNQLFTYQVTNYGQDCNSTLPALAPDSVGQNFPSHLDFGALLAWDTEYFTP